MFACRAFDRLTKARIILILTFALLSGISLAPAGLAAEPEFVGILALAVEDDVAERIDLSQDTYQALVDLIDRREAEALNLALELRTLPPEERAKRLAPFVQESERLGLALLTNEQQLKLRQLRVARAGLATLGEAEVAQQLQLTEEQKTQIAALLQARAAALTQGGENEQRLARADFERRLAGALTEPQRAAWQKLAGLLEESEQVAQASAMDGSARAPDVATPPTAPADPEPGEPMPVAPAPPSAAPAEPMPATPMPTELVPGAPSPGALSPAAPLPGTPSPGAPMSVAPMPVEGALSADIAPGPQADGGAPRENVKLRFNFRYAPWKDVIEWFAQQANLSVEGEAPSGTFNYTDNRSYTPAEAIDLLNSVLLTKGFTLLRRDRMLFVVDLESLEGGIPPNLVTRVTPEELDERGEYEIVSVLFPLSTMSTEEAEAELRPLLGRPGELVILPRSKQAWVTGTAGRLKTIRRVLEAVDQPDTTKNLNKFQVEHVSPEEVLTVVRKLMGIAEDANGAEDGSIRFTADPLSNYIYVGGQPEAIQRFEQILEMVDVEATSPLAGGGALETPQLEVYPITDADPASSLQVMQTLLAGLPGVRLAIDPVTGNLIALARPAEHATIKATLAQLQKETRQIAVMQLYRLDPQLAVVSINRMFGSGTETPDPKAPVVDADPTSGMLLVRGTQTQIDQIKNLLKQMGESPETLEGAVGGAAVGGSLGGNIRVLPLTGRAARDVLEQVELLWPTMRENRIRVVRPSAAIDTRQLNGETPSNRALPQNFDDAGAAPDQPSLRNSSPRLPLPFSPAPQEGDRKAPSPRATQPAANDAARQAPGRASIRKVVIGAGSREADLDVLRLALTGISSKGGRGEIASTARGNQEATPSTSRVITVGERSDQQPAPVRFAVEHNALAQADTSNAAQSETAAPPAGAAPAAEIIVRVTPNGLIVASEDLEALDDFETLLRTLSESAVLGGSEYTVFYLKYVQATVAAELLTQLLTGAPPDEGGGAAGGGLMGSLMSAALGNAGGGLVGSLLGGGGGASTSTFSTIGLNIVAEPRLNALVVQASPQELDMIEQLLKVIDQESSPESVQTLPPPRMIPVFNTSAESIATTVRQIYAQQVASGGGGQQRQPSPEDFIRALRGGGERAGRRAEQAVQQMTVSVDARSNSIVVSAPDPLFASVKALVEALDQPGLETPQATQVVSIQGANAAVVRQALTSVLGDVIKTNTPTSGAASTGGSSSSTQQESSRQPSSDDVRDQIRQRMEFFNALQRGREGDSGRSRGSSGGRSFGGGRRGR